MGELTEQDKAILNFERRFYRRLAYRLEAIESELGMGEMEYLQILAHLIDTQEALAYAPDVVYRLRRQRAGRQRARLTRRTREV